MSEETEKNILILIMSVLLVLSTIYIANLRNRVETSYQQGYEAALETINKE